MSLFQSSDEQKVRLYEIAAEMARSGLAKAFIAGAVELGSESEGIYDLMELWSAEQDPGERAEILADLQEAIDESSEQPARTSERRKIRYKSLDEVTRRIVSFKADLRVKVDRWGGISKLAEATGMPQPSLSRFFNSASMPRRTTLFKIAAALDLPDEEIVFDWVA
jgi:DNA-binding phage protein